MTRNSQHIALRELNAYFNSWAFYVLLFSFFLVAGLYTWFFNADVLDVQSSNILSFFDITFWLFLFFIPSISMGSFVSERKTGTLEVLQTKPIRNFDIVLGKFLAIKIVNGIILSIFFIYNIPCSSFNIAPSQIALGFFGLFLLSNCYASIGILVSSFVKNQAAAFLTTLGTLFLLHFVFGKMASYTTGVANSFLEYLAADIHYFRMTKGILYSKDIIYFVSITIICLLATAENLKKEE